MLVTVTDAQIPYGEAVYRKMIDAGIRVERDFRNEKLGYKIREGQMQKTPYMLVIGDREVQTETITPRMRDGKNLDAMTVETFIDLVEDECRQYH